MFHHIIIGVTFFVLTSSAWAQINLSNHKPAPTKIEQAYWTMIKDRQSPRLFEQYLMRFPNGKHIREATSIIESLPLRKKDDNISKDDQFDFSTSRALAVVSRHNANGRKEIVQNQPIAGTTSHQKTSLSDPSVTSSAIHEPLQHEDCGTGAECKKPPEPVDVSQRVTPPPVPIPTTAPPPMTNDLPDINIRKGMLPAEKSVLDLAFWTSIEGSANPALYKGYLEQFPNGTFAIIAREKLKKLKGNVIGTTIGKPLAPTSAQNEQQVSLNINGFGKLTGKTPFTLAAIKKALPGYDVKKIIPQPEEMTEIGYRVEKNGKLVMEIDGDRKKIISMKIYDRSVRGPWGVQVGDRLAQIMKKIKLSDCMGGYDEMVDRVVCFPEKDDDVFGFGFTLAKPLPSIADDQALTADMLPGDLRLTSIDWHPRDPATQVKILQHVADKPSAEGCPRADFKQFASKLKKGNIASIDKLKDKYKKIVFKKSMDCRSKLFHDLLSYHRKLVESHTTSVDKYFENAGDQPENIEKQYEKELERVGLRPYMIEGEHYTETDSGWYLREFVSFLPENWKIFLAQSEIEEKEGFIDDDTLIISREKLGKRIIFWENFLQKYPHFIKKGEIKELLSSYTDVFLLRYATIGQLNVAEIKELRPDIKKAYIDYLKTKSNTIYSNI